MNWNIVIAVSEVIGALAVIATLVFLARQISENTKCIRIQSLDSTFKEWNDLLGEIQSVEGVGKVFIKVENNDELTGKEQHKISYLYRRVFNIYSKIHYFSSIDAATNYNVDSIDRALPDFFKTSFFPRWWNTHHNLYADTFQKHIDEQLSKIA